MPHNFCIAAVHIIKIKIDIAKYMIQPYCILKNIENIFLCKPKFYCSCKQHPFQEMEIHIKKGEKIVYDRKKMVTTHQLLLPFLLILQGLCHSFQICKTINLNCCHLRSHNVLGTACNHYLSKQFQIYLQLVRTHFHSLFYGF